MSADYANQPGGAVFAIVNKVLDFLLVKFKHLPPPLRAVAYFIFLTFFCATVWRLTFGEYVVRGVIWDGDQFASSCEIRVRGDYFSTNSKGMYYAILTPSQYYRFLFAPDIDLPVMQRQADGSVIRLRGPFKVKLRWWDDEFTDIDLASITTGRIDKRWFHLTSAYAQAAPKTVIQTAPPAPNRTIYPSAGDRLVIEQITLMPSSASIREAAFRIHIGASEKPLLLQGFEAGTLPMRVRVTLGERYYFDVPRNRRGLVMIEMEDEWNFFSKDEEFAIKHLPPYETPLTVKGSNGSELVVRLVARGK